MLLRIFQRIFSIKKIKRDSRMYHHAYLIHYLLLLVKVLTILVRLCID